MNETQGREHAHQEVEEHALIGILAEEAVRTLVSRSEGVSMRVMGPVQRGLCLEVLFTGSQSVVASFLIKVRKWRWDILHEEDSEVQ